MSKISKSFKALFNIIKNPYLLNLVLEDNTMWHKYVSEKYPDLTRFPQTGFRELSGGLNDTIEPFLFLDGGSLPTDLALLRALAQKFSNCSYFEIGTWRGESVANVSPFAKTCITMDLPDEEKASLGMSREYILQHAMLSKHLSNVKHLKANSLTFNFDEPGQKFDLVFIDGDHHYKGVLNDTQKVFKQLLHKDSIVVWHDYAYHPEQVRYEVMAAILDGVDPSLHKNLFHVAHTMCAVYLPAGVAHRSSVSEIFSVNISLKN